MAIIERAVVRSSDNTLKEIRLTDTPLPLLKPGFVWMDVERITNDTSTTAYKSTSVASSVVGGKWRITTTVTDLAGAALTAVKSGQVSSADIALLEGVRMALNGLFFLANDIRTRTGAAALTKAQFANAISGLADFSRQEVIDFLVGKI